MYYQSLLSLTEASRRFFHPVIFIPAALAGVFPSSAICGLTKLYRMRCPSANSVFTVFQPRCTLTRSLIVPLSRSSRSRYTLSVQVFLLVTNAHSRFGLSMEIAPIGERDYEASRNSISRIPVVIGTSNIQS